MTFNAASPGDSVRAEGGEGRKNPVPYGTEVHATRYQYGFALTPAGPSARPDRAAIAVQAIAALGEVAGNHGRFLYDFSPESVIFRVTHDPAPRLLYIFEGGGPEVDAPRLLDPSQGGRYPGQRTDHRRCVQPDRHGQ